MDPQTFRYRTQIEASVDEVFRWHRRPGALQRLIPPWETVEVLNHTGGIEDGSVVTLRTQAGPLKQEWVVEHSDYIEGRQFRDIQIEGPFDRWEHTHAFRSKGDNACVLEDRIEYAFPGGALGRLLGNAFLQRKLDSTFRYRHEITQRDLRIHKKYQDRVRQNILITGSTGLIGTELVPFLQTGGHKVSVLYRPQSQRGLAGVPSARWDPAKNLWDETVADGKDAVIHLAGENISARWTDSKKKEIRQSRIDSTRTLVKGLLRLSRSPKTVIFASAIGFYGDRGEEVISEEATLGKGFLAELCRDWEKEAKPLLERGIRVVHLRFGVVLSPKKGALAKMLKPFKIGLGGTMGSGKQFISWLSIDDAVGIIYHLLMEKKLSGVVNAVSPLPVRNEEFTRTLGETLGRPTLLPMPNFAARMAFGQMADELLLASTRVTPSRLVESGYEFIHEGIEKALSELLGKNQGSEKCR